MSEKQSVPQTDIDEDLEKVSQIASAESQIEEADDDSLRQESEAFEGKTPQSQILDQLGSKDEKIEHLRQEVKTLRLKNQLLEYRITEEIRLDNDRRDYAKSLFALTIAWLSIVVLLVLASGLKLPYFNNPACSYSWCVSFGLSEGILIAFITSTTATVIGIFVIVARWLFRVEKASKKTS